MIMTWIQIPFFQCRSRIPIRICIRIKIKWIQQHCYKQVSLQVFIQNCANGDYLYFYQIYSLQLETYEVYKLSFFRSTSLILVSFRSTSLILVSFRSTSQILVSFNRNLYVDFKNGLNFENPITNESVICRPLFLVFQTPCSYMQIYIKLFVYYLLL